MSHMLAERERSGGSPRQAGPLQVVLVNNSDEQAGTQGSFALFRKQCTGQYNSLDMLPSKCFGCMHQVQSW